MKRWFVLALTFVSTLTIGNVAFAENAEKTLQVIPGSDAAFYFSMTVIAAGIGIAMATWLTGNAQGKTISSALEGIARQPEAAAKIQTVMIIGLAFIESLVIYALLISLILLLLNPFKDLFVQAV